MNVFLMTFTNTNGSMTITNLSKYFRVSGQPLTQLQLLILCALN